MAKKERDYTNLKETEKIRDAVKRTSTQVKDYSLKNIVDVYWKTNELDTEYHLSRVRIGTQTFVGFSNFINKAVHALVERQNEHDWLPRDIVRVESFRGATPMLILDTRDVNNECLRDHVARVTIGECNSLIDLEELLKATRYA